MRELSPPLECANCGATLLRSARACPDCGADERTGWRDASLYDGLDLPAAAWSEDDEAAHDRRTSDARRVNGVAWYWWVAGVALVALMIWALLGFR